MHCRMGVVVADNPRRTEIANRAISNPTYQSASAPTFACGPDAGVTVEAVLLVLGTRRKLRQGRWWTRRVPPSELGTGCLVARQLSGDGPAAVRAQHDRRAHARLPHLEDDARRGWHADHPHARRD